MKSSSAHTSVRGTRPALPIGRHSNKARLSVPLVDPAEDNRAMYAEFMRAAGFHPIEADNASDALALAATADIVVTEIRLPGPFDGVELVRRVRADERSADKPIIILTATLFAQTERLVRDAGSDVFLTKPCLPEALATEIHRVMLARVPVRRPARAPSAPTGDVA
jgi:DNA-binding response OmpR family regulator